MIDLYVLGAIAGLTVATFVARSALLLFGSSLLLPPALEAALRYAPACALAAIIVPDLLLQNGVPLWGPDNHRLLAGVAGTAIFVAFRSTFATIIGGMGVFWLLQWIH
ncbi:MAG: AzlD domain-containing protein [Steroidobacteraceae bacterium]